MNKYTFSTQSGKAYYCNSIPGFIKDNSTNIICSLVCHGFGNNDEIYEYLKTCGIKEIQC